MLYFAEQMDTLKINPYIFSFVDIHIVICDSYFKMLEILHINK